ncbi:MAG: methylated-DNA--[protein]-cysteine S-methyltransferase [Verrucomicrobiota bacterium]
MSTTQQIPTTLGSFHATYSAQGLAALDFPGQTQTTAPDMLAPVDKDFRAWNKLTTDALLAITAGKSPARLPPLDLSWGSDFQRAVWQLLLAIPLGQTRTYGELTQDLNKTAGARAVGAACGANPIPVIIPCHRVVAANGKLGGFSGGLDWKRRLLQIEGVLLA